MHHDTTTKLRQEAQKAEIEQLERHNEWLRSAISGANKAIIGLVEDMSEMTSDYNDLYRERNMYKFATQFLLGVLLLGVIGLAIYLYV